MSIYTSVKRNKPVKWWHEFIIDDMIAHPMDTLAQRGKRLGYTVAYLNTIINSDLFKALLAQRRKAFAEGLDTSIQQKTVQMADKALDLVLQTLEKKRDSIPFPALAEFTDKTLERLGYGTKKGGTAVQVNVNTAPVITPEQLADARAALRAVEDSRVVEHKARELPSKPPTPLRVVGEDEETT